MNLVWLMDSKSVCVCHILILPDLRRVMLGFCNTVHAIAFLSTFTSAKCEGMTLSRQRTMVPRRFSISRQLRQPRFIFTKRASLLHKRLMQQKNESNNKQHHKSANVNQNRTPTPWLVRAIVVTSIAQNEYISRKEQSKPVE